MSGWAGAGGPGGQLGALGAMGAMPAPGALYVPDCEEVRVSAAVARRGHLNVLQHGTHGWKKRWLVCDTWCFIWKYFWLYRFKKMVCLSMCSKEKRHS